MCFTTKTTNTTTTTPTAAEKQLESAQLSQFKKLEPQQTQYYGAGFDLATQLLKGGTLPGYLSPVAQGLNPNAIAEQAALYGAKAMPGFQELGIVDSGQTQRAISKGIAQEILLPTTEYNANVLMNLLNLASGHAAQGTSQFQAGTSLLAQELAGLRSVSQTQTSNPFLQSFASSLGNTAGLGNVSFSRSWP